MLANTVSSSFTDEDLMFSRISDLRIHGKTQNKKEKSTPSIADTVVGSFTDEDLILSELNMEKKIENNVNKDRLSTVADTVVGPFTDEDLSFSQSFVREPNLEVKKIYNEPRQCVNASKQEQNMKQNLKARVIKTDNDTDDESLDQTANNLVDDKNEATDNDESSSEEEVISILDSDEELDDFSAEPPLHKENDSFVNCSTIQSKISSDTSTLPESINTFFNNPPSVKSDEITVSHTMIRHFKNNVSNVDEILDVAETSFEDRFVRKSNVEDEDVIINESVEISESSDNDLKINKNDFNNTF